MGVIGLWSLINDAGTKANVDSLQGTVLAIDLSIWINQSIKGFRDKNGRSVENAHILGLFNRICKLLYYKIKPIFVFDGECPTLKLHTIQRRHERSRKILEKSKNLSLSVIENYINSQLNANDKNSSLTKLKFSKNSELLSEFLLPPSREMDIYRDFVELDKGLQNKISDSDEDDDNKSDIEESSGTRFHHPDFQNIYDIDINSSEFKNLPPPTRYELLVEIRESYKQRKHVCPERLPTESDSFSKYQLKKVLKKRNLQEEIDNLVEVLNCAASHDDLEQLRSSSNIDSDMLETSKFITGRLASDATRRYLLLKSTNFIDDVEIIDPSVPDSKKMSKNDVQDNSVYETPNTLPGQSDEMKISKRIETLAESSNKNVRSSFQSKQIGGQLGKNVEKFFDKNSDSKVNLSETDSDDSDDFVEVPMECVESSSQDEGILFMDSSLPYTTTRTDCSIDIPVDFNENSNLPVIDVESSENIQNSMLLDSNQDSSIKEQESEVILIDDSPKKNSEANSEIVSDLVCEDVLVTPNVPSNKIESNNGDDCLSKEQKQFVSVKEPVCQKENTQKDSKLAETASVKKPVNVEMLAKNSKESSKLSRQAASVTQQMISDCQELLTLFGIPWVVAPSEAEAQCAALEELGFCNGIITDDSDVFLFGGKTIYKHFFDHSRHISRFVSDDIEKYFGLNRTKLICLSMLCGTDYTLGVENVGPVTAMEILSEFPGNDMQPLVDFSKWHRDKMNSTTNSCKPENKVREKLLKLTLPDTFPSSVIFDAYLNANVDHSKEPFKWSSPQLSELRRFAFERLKWSEEKSDLILLPVLKKMNEKQVQSRIDYFFASTSRNVSVNEKLKLKRSKRLNEAIRRNINLSFAESKVTSKTKKPVKRLKGKKNQVKQENQLVLSEESSSD